MRRCKPKLVAFHAPNCCVVCLTQPGRVLGDRVSTGWISVGELAMTPKNFTRRSLLLQ